MACKLQNTYNCASNERYMKTVNVRNGSMASGRNYPIGLENV